MKYNRLCFILFFFSILVDMEGQNDYVLIDQLMPDFIKTDLHDTVIGPPSWPTYIRYNLDLDKNNKTDISFVVENHSESAAFVSKVKVECSDSCLTFVTLGNGFRLETSPKDTLVAFKTPIGKIFNALDKLYADSCISKTAELSDYFEIKSIPQTVVMEWVSGIHFFGFKKTITNKDYLGWVKLEIKGKQKMSITLNEYVIQELPVGISELKNSSVIMYPNPVSDVLTIKDESCKKIEVYNTLGELLLSEENKNGNTFFSVDIRHFNAGVYLVKIIERDKSGYLVKKFIKR